MTDTVPSIGSFDLVNQDHFSVPEFMRSVELESEMLEGEIAICMVEQESKDAEEP